MTQVKKSSYRWWIWALAAVVLVAVYFSVRSLVQEKLPVRCAQALHEPLASTISTNGRVEPVVNYDLLSPLSTTVKSLRAQQGDAVAAGQLLIELDDMQARKLVASAESGLKSAQAAYDAVQHNGAQQERQAAQTDLSKARIEREQATRDLNALTRLQASGAASTAEVAAAQSRLHSAEASERSAEQSAHNRYSQLDRDRAKAAVAEAEAALTEARSVLARTRITAPASGSLYSLSVARGAYAEEGKSLASLADLRNIRIRAYFDEPDLGRLAVGQKVQIKWSALPGRLWTGSIERLPSVIITYGTRNVGEVLVHVNNPDGQLLPQTNVIVTATLFSEAHALSIPREAMRAENGQPYVYRIIGGQLKRTSVTTGAITLTQVAVLSGLSAGDLVATTSTNGQPLREGVPVKVVR